MTKKLHRLLTSFSQYLEIYSFEASQVPLEPSEKTLSNSNRGPSSGRNSKSTKKMG